MRQIYKDKNGRIIVKNDMIRKCATHGDYLNPRMHMVYEVNGELFLDGKPISEYHTANGYTTLEIA